jgi:hypothetical protein
MLLFIGSVDGEQMTDSGCSLSNKFFRLREAWHKATIQHVLRIQTFTLPHNYLTYKYNQINPYVVVIFPFVNIFIVFI